MITSEDVKKLADLSRIAITDEEVTRFAREIESILGYVSEIQNLPAGEQVSRIGQVHNVLREDGPAHDSGMYTEALLSEAPVRQGNHVRVKRILP